MFVCVRINPITFLRKTVYLCSMKIENLTMHIDINIFGEEVMIVPLAEIIWQEIQE